MFGDIIITNSDRSFKYIAETTCVVWVLDSKSIKDLEKENNLIYEELLAVYIRYSTQRSESVISNVLISY